MKSSNKIFSTADVVESVFYKSFNQCDFDKMRKVWADDEVVCVHPGSAAIVGYAAVLRSWQHILSNAQLPDIQVSVIKRTISETLAVHLVEEHIETGKQNAVVLATNVYQKYDSGWLMVEHHGSVIHSQTEPHTLQ